MTQLQKLFFLNSFTLGVTPGPPSVEREEREEENHSTPRTLPASRDVTSHATRSSAGQGYLITRPHASRKQDAAENARPPTPMTDQTNLISPLINIRIVAKIWPAVSYLHIHLFLYSS